MNEDYWKGLVEFGTPRQKEAVRALLKHGTRKQAAEAMGISAPGFRRILSLLRRRAASRGYAPDKDMTESTADGYHVKGVSTYYQVNPQTGERVAKGQWVKTQKDRDQQLRLLMDTLYDTFDTFKGHSPTAYKSAKAIPSNKDLLCVYPMGDPHIGMHAWADETGDRNFNLKIARRNLTQTVQALTELAPPSERALIINLGDYFHADNMRNVTSRSGASLDVDGRLPKVLRTGIDLFVECILSALTKHDRVDVICAIGNHDDMMSVVLAVALDLYFRNNDRVNVETRPRQHHYYTFGECLLGVHHGHATKFQELPGVMAADMPGSWGQSKHRRWYCGHVHHDSVKEYPGCTVETFRTLAPKDAWHAGQGYRAGNDMKLDVWHKSKGHINRHIVGIESITEGGE